MNQPLPTNLPNAANARLPERYEQAKADLAECVRVDECKTWADKAEALASYARQADDDELEAFARRVRARAIRRCGELLKEIERPSQGGRPSQNGDATAPVSRKAAADEAGMSERQRKTALRVANVPEPEFEEAVEGDKPETVTSLARKGTKSKPKPLVDLNGRDPEEFKLATQIGGSIRYFADELANADPAAVARGLSSSERGELKTSAGAISDWLGKFKKHLEKTHGV